MDCLDDYYEAVVKRRGREVLETKLVANCTERLTIGTSYDQIDSRKFNDAGGVNLCNILGYLIKNCLSG